MNHVLNLNMCHLPYWLEILVLTIHCGYGNSDSDTIDSNIKFILIWTPQDHSFSVWKSGRDTFIEKRCLYKNCFVVTREEMEVSDDLSIFDAIVFNGHNMEPTLEIQAPSLRFPNQEYIYFNIESSDNEPACHPSYNNFFNLTATYKLNSDIQFSYIEVRHNGIQVGPKKDMFWLDITNRIEIMKHSNKTKAAAWFVSNCYARSHRQNYAKLLERELKRLNLDLDIYGGCSKVKCPENKCRNLLYKYYFYLAFENSFSEDYVTEKLLTALNNNAVPIVYGGANYSRSLPPGSYLDAKHHPPEQMAAIIQYFISNPAEYNEFFSWKGYYSYHEPENDCRLCAALNNKSLMSTHKVYHDFRSWWNPDYKERCHEYSLNKNKGLS